MANPATQTCPACGAESTGKFCSTCGAPLGGAACGKCGAKLSARAKFCPACGALAGRAAAAPRPLIAPNQRAAWIVAGVCVVALLITIVVLVARRPPAAQGEAGATPSGAGAPATTDLSQMSPVEQATRLFDRTMRAEESGDTAQVNFFAPMAVQAYQVLGGELDPDMRLHVGLLQLAAKNPAGARAEADTLLKASRTHLYGLLLKARAAEAMGDAATARSSMQAFVANYDAERAKKLPEYAEHNQLLIETRDQATRGAGAAAKR